ncbi:Bacterial extracellular solute-binding protein, putative [Synechococcus sp. PCC 7335]|uniref:PstS family phosphate ABC transporter substrate-binding protein n=1 Tax=Synechococcus sp. (strain ATCC 29403 / PCC 7335) TaxID=91464 RepID=UPI00017EE3EA|nr:PstS family phosphate ABC transporter substrate-binding protein [Synechococcus sp. PCC 7335]EDX83948.1 Bacterial extracellular solute-binding protein, putative [Synechococcus sp. PCC 7335]
MQRFAQKIKSAARPARLAYSFSILALSASLAACGGGTAEDPAADVSAADADSGVSGEIQIDGSSTVFPISEAMAEEFQIANPDTRVTVGVSGSGGGFKKFCAGETDISNASRPIKEEEVALCDEAGIEFIEVPIAYDGITLVTNPENDWAQCLTVEQLNAMWSPDAEGSVENWNQVDPEFPDEPLELFGPGTDSGTFDYFTDEVSGEEGASRGDYTASEDDNVIVTGVESTSGGLGYFGYAYYEENQDQLKSVEIENEAGECVAPSRETIADGSYNPMSRPLYFYVQKEAYDTKPQVKAFVDYQLDAENGELVQEAGYITLPDDALAQAKSRVEEGKLGKDPI